MLEDAGICQGSCRPFSPRPNFLSGTVHVNTDCIHMDLAWPFWQTISLAESTAFFYYRPLFLETQEKICNFFGKIYYVTILCKLYYVNRTNFSGRQNRKMHDVVAEWSAASKCWDCGSAVDFCSIFRKPAYSPASPARMAFMAMAHSKRFRCISQPNWFGFFMSPLTSRFEAEHPPLQ